MRSLPAGLVCYRRDRTVALCGEGRNSPVGYTHCWDGINRNVHSGDRDSDARSAARQSIPEHALESLGHVRVWCTCLLLRNCLQSGSREITIAKRAPNRTRTKFPIFVKRRRSIVRFSMPCSLRRCPPMLRSCFGCYGRCLWKCRRRLHEIAEHAPTIGGKHYTPIYMEQLFASDAPASSAGIKECAAAVRAPVSRWVSITQPKLQSTHGPAQFSRRG